MSNVRCSLHRFHRHRRRSRFLLRLKISQRRVSASQVVTSDGDGERRSFDVLSVVLDGHEVLARNQGSVTDLVSFVNFVAREIDLGGAVDGDRKRSGSDAGRVDDERRRLTGHTSLDALTGNSDGRRVVVVAAFRRSDHDLERGTGNVNAVEFGMLKLSEIISKDSINNN